MALENNPLLFTINIIRGGGFSQENWGDITMGRGSMGSQARRSSSVVLSTRNDLMTGQQSTGI